MNDAFDLYISGAPDRLKLEALRQAGVRHVIDLRHEAPEHSQAICDMASELGLKYCNLPVSAPEDLCADKVRALHDLLSDVADDEGVLLHCASGMRAAAMMTLRSVWEQGLSAEEALKYWRQQGLGKLEAAVMQCLA